MRKDVAFGTPMKVPVTVPYMPGVIISRRFHLVSEKN